MIITQRNYESSISKQLSEAAKILFSQIDVY